METIKPTHADLVACAAKWLKRTCSVVLTEVSVEFESPDAIGWNGPISTLIECKVSRNDFFADQSKTFRRFPNMGAGVYRYYMTPPGLVQVSELPQGWGLIECDGKRMILINKSVAFTAYWIQEARLLCSTLRRIGHNAPEGISIKCYTHQTQAKATCSVEGLE